jgi:hypothetical protein
MINPPKINNYRSKDHLGVIDELPQPLTQLVDHGELDVHFEGPAGFQAA